MPFGPVPLSDIVTVPTVLPWASFISTTVFAALDSDQKIITDDTAATRNRFCFMAQIITKLWAVRHFVGVYFEKWPRRTPLLIDNHRLEKLRRQPKPANKLLETGLTAQRIVSWINLESGQAIGMLLVRFFQPVQSLVLIA